jgi:hypothetical protein
MRGREMRKGPIFVVGVQRSGTTLLAAMLASHSRLSCGPETHFFRRLAEADTDQLCAAESWPDRALAFLASIRHSAFEGHESISLLEKYGLQREEVANYLKLGDPSVPRMLAGVTTLYMRRLGKRRWVEKTPDHIRYVQQIRKYFPDSPIIRIVRDPRDVALSLMEVPWGTRSLLEGLLFWKQVDEASDSFFLNDGRSHSLRFEDLLGNPQDSLQRLCRFLGEEYEPTMMDTASAGSQLNSRGVPWKENVRRPLNSGRLEVWKRKLCEEKNRLAEAFIGDRLQRYGYPRVEHFSRLGRIYPDLSSALGYSTSLSRVSNGGVRFWKASPGERVTVRVYLGDPEETGWLPKRKRARFIATSEVVFRILQSTLWGGRVYWISAANQGWSGYCAFLLKTLLAPFRLTLGSEAAGDSQV